MSGKILFFFCTLLIILPTLVGAQTGADATTPFQSLVGIPGVTGENGVMSGSFNDYVNALYALAIGIAGLLAVIKLIVAGTKYMLSDIVTTKQDAKNDIKWSLVGLLVVLGAVVILTTINTDLTNVDVTLTQLDGDTTNYLAENLERIRDFEEYCNAADNCIVRDCFFDCEAWCNNIPGSRFVPGTLLGYTLGAANYRDQCYYDPNRLESEGTISEQDTAANSERLFSLLEADYQSEEVAYTPPPDGAVAVNCNSPTNCVDLSLSCRNGNFFTSYVSDSAGRVVGTPEIVTAGARAARARGEENPRAAEERFVVCNPR